MKLIATTRCAILTALFLLLVNIGVAQAQSTAFTYQGKLTNGVGPATGSYDFQFKLFDAQTVGTQLGTTNAPTSVAVNSGIFTVTLDFGAAAFPGANRWLEISVRLAGTGAFTTLSPRQQITATPYAINSLNATAATNATTAVNFSGSLIGDVTGGQSATAIANNAVTGAKIATGQVVKSLNGFFDAVTLAAGSNITLTPSGNTLTIGAAGAANNWSLTGNAGSNPSLNFIGTTDNQPLAFRINGAEVMRMIAGGNVGIGTPTPAGLLHVKGASPVRILGEVSTLAGAEFVDFMARNTPFSSDMGGMRIQRQVSTGDVDTLFFAAASGSSMSEAMRVKGNGNVGIGTPTPGYKLDVADRMRVRQAGGNTAGIWLYQTTPANDRAFVGMVDDTHVGFYGNTGAGFGLTMNTTNGGVGIGTTDVSQFVKLDVSGGNFTHAVRGNSFLGIGVWGSSGGGTGVYGDGGTSGTGVEGTSGGNGTGVKGSSMTGDGVVGVSTSHYGVSGRTASTGFNVAGVFGEATASSGNVVGVYGRSLNDTSGTGVAGFGRATGGYFSSSGNVGTGVGAYGTGDQYGVDGQSPNGTGVIGTGRFGVSGFGHTGGYGGYFNNVDPGQIALFVEGTGRMNVLQVAGSDVAERFDAVLEAKPGLVVAIDPDHPGQLAIAHRAYNRRVAGVISGANKLDAGMVLADLPGSKNSLPVALSGRVWVYCDATRSAIHPGDLLTTSNTPGHAMKVTNHAKAQGAIIGKAMTGLKSGRGLVLVLVTLQ